MKVSAVSLSVLLFASLGSSLSIRSPPPGHDEEGKDLASGLPRWPPEKPPPVGDITFSWCLDYTRPDTCFSRELKHGECYNLGVLDPKMSELVEDVGVEGGACMFFRLQRPPHGRLHWPAPLDIMALSETQQKEGPMEPRRSVDPLLFWLAKHAVV
ncbi:hypothetical protein ACHAPV_004156 [Trichoderma viride]